MSIRTDSPSLPEAMAASLGYQVNLTGKLFSAALSARLPAGMTTTQVGLLAWLAEHPGSSQREISTGTGIDTATLTEMLRRLAGRGTIRRDPDPHDARRNLVSLGDVEAAVVEEGLAAAHDVNRRAVAGLSEQEVATLTELLARVRQNLT